jgi:aerobic-type carbon monoxide dehydrogenase small subunit (CoxS/CutS family)
MINLNVNGKDRAVNVAGDTPLLWVLRETPGASMVASVQPKAARGPGWAVGKEQRS